jgi:hypothetical protein
VSEGTYNTEADINIKNNVSLYGGYDSVTWERDYEQYVTTVQDTRTVGTDTSSSDYPYTVFYADSISNATVIDGFTLKGLEGGGAGFTSAVYCNNASGPTIRNNIISGGSGSTYSYGIYLRLYLSLIIDNNIINGGSGSSSYALYGRLNNAVRITNNILSGGSGGITYGAYFRQSSDPYFYNNIITGGSGNHTYGIYTMNLSGSVVVIRNNTINGGNGTLNNHSYGICVRNSEPVIENNIIFCFGNSDGYGIYEYDSEPSSANNNDLYNCSVALYHQYNGGSPNELTAIADINALSYADSNVSADPQFSNPANNDFHLTGSTPSSVTDGGLNGIDQSWAYFPENASGNPVDKDGIKRPASGSSWAIGVYED